jgi:hypothetical protein
MKNFLVKFDGNWADEFDTNGFQLMSEKEWVKLFYSIKNTNYPLEIYFGSNEFWTFERPEDILDNLTLRVVTKEEAKIIDKYFDCSKWYGYGHTPFEQILDNE